MARRRFTDVEVGITVVKFVVEIVKMFKGMAITNVLMAIRGLSIQGYSNAARELIYQKAVIESTEVFAVIENTEVVEAVPAIKAFKELD